MNEINTQKPKEKTGKARQENRRAVFLQQIGLNMVMLGVLVLLGFLVWQRFLGGNGRVFAASSIAAGSTANGKENLSSDLTPSTEESSTALSPLPTPGAIADGITRITNLLTVIPSRPRVDVITYTVETGDTLFSIAYDYNLKPGTLLWANYDVLNDNPHLLKPKQVLYILPVNGVYYQWKENDTLQGVADEFHADPQDILEFPGNHFDLTKVDQNGAGIQPGTWVIIPGGSRPIKDWGPPAITRQNPASAKYYGEGSCGTVYEGAFGTGTFIWPTTDHGISGYHYEPGVHPAIDIAGQEGNPVYATDSGVIVYAGWSNYGYGNLIVIDHGNGWQSAYAHLSAVAVTCGQSVYQGGYIGALGSTGNSSGPHLHFELVINGVKVNPLDYVR
jgi:LysM repeat protein